MEIPEQVPCPRCAFEHDVHAAECPRCTLMHGRFFPGMKTWEPPVEGFQYAIAVSIGAAYVLPDARLAYADGTSETPSGAGFVFFKLPGGNVNDRVRLNGFESVLPADPARAMKCPDCKQHIAGETFTEETTACPYCTIVGTVAA